MRIKNKNEIIEVSEAWIENVRYNKNKVVKELTKNILEDIGTYTHRGRFCLACRVKSDNSIRCFGDYKNKSTVDDMLNVLATNGMLNTGEYEDCVRWYDIFVIPQSEGWLAYTKKNNYIGFGDTQDKALHDLYKKFDENNIEY